MIITDESTAQPQKIPTKRAGLKQQDTSVGSDQDGQKTEE
jgi:hypothetical protein